MEKATFCLYIIPGCHPLRARKQNTDKPRQAKTSQDQNLASAIHTPPFTAFQTQAKLRNISIRAKVPETQRQYLQRQLKELHNCEKHAQPVHISLKQKMVKSLEIKHGKLTRSYHMKIQIIYI